MKKINNVLVLFLFVLICEPALTLAQTECRWFKFKGNLLNIRNKNTVKSVKVGKYNKFDVFCILQKKGDWGKTNKGWVFLKLAKRLDVSGCQRYQITTKSLNIREKKNKLSKKQGRYLAGEKFCVFAKNEGWGRTKKGWISLKYIELEKQTKLVKHNNPAKPKPLSKQSKLVKPKTSVKQKVSAKLKKQKAPLKQPKLNKQKISIKKVKPVIQLKRFQVGLGIAIWNVPEEREFSNEGISYNLFIDYNIDPNWIILRLGYLNYKSGYSNAELSATLSNSVIHASYMISPDDGIPNFDLFYALGIAKITSDLEIVETSTNRRTESDSGLGYMSIIGAEYSLDETNVGVQYIYISRKAQFETADVWVGTNQVQIYAAYPF